MFANRKLFGVLFLAFITLFFMQPAPAQAPGAVLKGSVKNAHGEIIVGAVVAINSLNRVVTTDHDGRFEFTGLPPATYQLQVKYIGHADLAQSVTITTNGEVSDVELVMTEHVSELSAVEIVGKTETQLAKELSIKAEVINTKALATQPATMIELMNRAAGIRVRQTGGLGSSASLMVNGFQDKAIKYFKDGIPMEYLGAGYNFALVPVNMVERLEIYKGVLPTALGADALGGGLNMVSKKSLMRYMEASYEVASFNTHRASLNLLHHDTTRHFFVGADAFLNYSDNSYEVTAPVADRDLGTQRNVRVKAFNNQFRHYYAEVYGGVSDTRWADELRVGITAFSIDRQNQYGTRMSQAFGASKSAQYAIIPTLRYRKGFLHDRVVVDQFLVANTIHVDKVDTARGTYNWLGEFFPNNAFRGEETPQGSLAKTRFSYFTSRTNLAFHINAAHKLELNAVYATLGRIGRDPLGLTFKESGRDILSVPAHYDKIILAMGLESRLFDGRLVNNLIGKFFHAETSAIDADYEGDEINRSSTNQRWGLAEAVKYSVSDNSFVRLSAETATRLPEQDEIFGDGNLHISNFALKPERSVNANVGYRTERFERYSLELNSFYRVTHDLILNVPYNLIFNQHQNVEQVRGLGFEADATVSLLPWLKANGNFTYQNFRLFDTGNKTTEGARLRNTPFFFANLGLNAARSHVLREADKLQVYWYFTFVREYYRDYIPKDREPDGFLGLWGKAGLDAPNTIPDQSVHTMGLTYFPFGERFSAGAQVKNVFDAAVYDNFRIQNAGRSFHFKLTYIFK